MMEIRDSVAPPYRVLRPLRPERTARFPVYADLVERLSAPEPGADAAVAHTLAVCSGYAYAGPDVLVMMMARMGLEDSCCHSIALAVDPMFVRSTANVVQSKDGRVVIVGYRGTEPTSLINWLTDADVYPERVRFALADDDADRGVGDDGDDHGPDDYTVHAGFYRNVRATRFEVLNALERASKGESVLAAGDRVEHPMQTLYLTGHSLGGAMAALMAIMLVSEPAFEHLAERLTHVATYGQPMVGSPELARACQQHDVLGPKVRRYVYADDVVAHLPPRDSGEYEHFGQELRFEGTTWEPTEPTDQMLNLAGLLETPVSYLSRRIELLRRLPVRYSIDDHLPHHYIAALTPDGVSSEFGDVPYAGGA